MSWCTRVAPMMPLAVMLAAVAGACSTSGLEEPSRPSPSSTPSATEPRADETVLLRPSRGGRVRAVQLGTGRVTAGITTLAGGRISDGPGPGPSRAFVFPPYVGEGRYPRAVISVTNASDQDVLDPGDEDFSWGASFKLDADSEGREDDNGNNLLQRGLFSQPTFYKAEVDDDRAACAIRGLRGVVIVHSSYTMPTGVWHRLQCDRFDDYVRLQVWDLDAGELVSSAAKAAPIGTLSTPSGHREVPLAIGGKVNPDGRVTATASDQFNGSIAAPFLRIGD